MSVDLKRLPDDEEIVRTMITQPDAWARAIQNVLDGLNWYRCRAKFAEQELARHPEPDDYDEAGDRGDWKFHQDHDQ